MKRIFAALTFLLFSACSTHHLIEPTDTTQVLDGINSNVDQGGRVNANETSFQGLALYGMCHPRFDCGSALYTAFAGVNPISFAVLADRTFSDNCPCFDALAADPRANDLEVHGVNGAGLRNGRLQPQECLYGYNLKTFQSQADQDNPQLMARLKACFQREKTLFVDKLRPNQSCTFSPVLEYDGTQRGWVNIARVAQGVIGNRCALVYNPNGGNSFGNGPIPGYIHELHGDWPHVQPTCIVDNDGTRVVFNSARAFLDRYGFCSARYYWHECDNGNEGALPGSFIPGRQRIAWCTKDDFFAFNQILRPIPPPTPQDKQSFAGCKTIAPLGEGNYKIGNLWKKSDPTPPNRPRIFCGRVARTALLLDAKFKSVKNIGIVKDGAPIDRMCYRGLRTEDKTGRPTFYSDWQLEDYPYHLVLHGDGGICWTLDNPKYRND